MTRNRTHRRRRGVLRGAAVIAAVVSVLLGASASAPGQPNSFPAGGAGDAAPVASPRADERRRTARSTLATSTTPAQRTAAKPRIGVWYVPWDKNGGISSLERFGSVIGEVSPFWFELRANGRVGGASGAYDIDVLRAAQAADMRILPTISNSFETSRASSVLTTAARRRTHIARLVALVEGPAYVGLDVDYENVAPSDKHRFTAFVRDLDAALNARGKQLSVTIMAKTSDRGHSNATRSMDYAAIGRYADQVRIMAYDYHWSCGSPGPIAPADWVEDVVAYAVTRIPPEKLVLGVPFYGYDWPRSGCADARTWNESVTIARRSSSRLGWLRSALTRFVRYATRTLWYEDAASIDAKSEIAARYGIRGVFAWRLGHEDPGIWQDLTVNLGESTTPGDDDGEDDETAPELPDDDGQYPYG